MQRITPFLWFDNQALDAAKFYTSIFKNSAIGQAALYPEESLLPVGEVMTVPFALNGFHCTALNGGPVFQCNPSISFCIECETSDELMQIWNELSVGGSVMMELGPYPFSTLFGWLNDKFGVSWQLNLTGRSQHISPCLLFTGQHNGKAEEAIEMYMSIFENSEIQTLVRYDSDDADTQGNVKHARFTLAGQSFIAMDSGIGHKFSFNEAVSLVVNCNSQEEIDVYWQKLSAARDAEKCGWLKDAYGVSWQIVPTVLQKILSENDPLISRDIMKAVMSMKKLDRMKILDAA